MRSFFLPILLATACNGPSKDSDTGGTTPVDSADSGATGDSGTTTHDSNDSGNPEIHVTLQGSVKLFAPEQLAAPEGSCVTVLDPSGGLNGGNPETLGSATTDKDGNFSVNNIPLRDLPPMILVDDCGANPPTLFTTATPVPTYSLSGLKDGDTVNNIVAEVLPAEAVDVISGSLQAAKNTTDITKDGVLLGFVWDKNHMGVAGATVSCQGCQVYYGDSSPDDGMFTTGPTVNAATDASGFYLIPAAPIGDITVQANGYTFPTYKGGAIPHGALLMIIPAQ
jgi:hypothetical protein